MQHWSQHLCTLFLFLDPSFHNPCTSFVCLSLLPKEQRASKVFFPVHTVFSFFFNTCVQFGISDTVTCVILALCAISDTVTEELLALPQKQPSASLQLSLKSDLSSHHCSITTWEIQLSLVALSATFVSFLRCCLPYAAISHTMSCSCPCSVQRPSPQASAQSMASNLPVLPGNER